MKATGSPIVLTQALNTGDGSKASLSAANGLVSRLYLSIGAKVLLTRNVWQRVGLCNGASGIVRDIIFKPDAPPPALAECIIVDFGDGYNGPSFFPLDDERKSWVPIFPVTSDWSTVSPHGESSRHSRTMFPLRLCYAWTIWKAQGQTLYGKVVVSLGEREREHGLTYTAFSRVKKMSNLGILGGLTFNRLTKSVRNQGKMALRMKEEKRLSRLVTLTIRELNE